MKIHNSKSGQVLVIILLIMIVGLTIGLFLLGRTTTDISLTSRTTESSRAFNAAEAGIEEAIRSLSGITSGSPVPYASGLSYNVDHSSLGGTASLYPGPATTQKVVATGDTFTVWLVPHNADGTINYAGGTPYTAKTLDLCFTRGGGGTIRSAFGVTLFYLNGAQVLSSYAVYNDSVTNIPGAKTGAISPPGTQCATYDGRFTMNLLSFSPPDFGSVPYTKMVALRIKLLLAGNKVAVNPPVAGPGNILPVQGNDIKSTGNSGDVTRKIDVEESFTEPVPFMDNVLFSRSTLSK